MTVVDASVWVASFLADEVHHARSLQWVIARSEDHQALLVPTIALAEVAGAVARRSGSSLLGRQSARYVFALPSSQVVALDAVLGNRAADIAATYRLHGADALYVAVAETHNVPLVTWDAELAARARDVVHVIEP